MKIKIELQPYKRISSVTVLRGTGRQKKVKKNPARPQLTNLVKKGGRKVTFNHQPFPFHFAGFHI